MAAGEAILNQANIPTFAYPDTAARMFNYMWRYAYNLRGLYETPMLPANGDGGRIDRAKAQQIIADVRESGRTILTEFESKQLLAAYGIPTVRDAHRAERRRSGQGRRRDRLSRSCSSCTRRRSRTRPMSAACS